MDTLSSGSYSNARAQFKDLLDAAERGRPAFVKRDEAWTAVVSAGQLRFVLSRLTTTRAEAVAEADGWSILIRGLPLAADGAIFEEALDEMVDLLREYARDWQYHLLDTPNHRNSWGLVQLISLSDDDQLRTWLSGMDREQQLA